MSRPVGSAAVTALVALAASGCAAHRLAYAPDELRAELGRRAPGIPAGELVVPFEIDGAAAALARSIVSSADTDGGKVSRLAEAFFDPAAFGLVYAPGVTGGAAETLRRRRGNCLALASAFVGLARAAGLHAYYMDASVRVHETRVGEDGLAVNEGHVTAMVESGGTRFGLDFAQLGQIQWYRVLDDMEALAHFYNNRGFELVEDARERGAPVDWEGAAHQFRLAVLVMPDFARAWNNLGIADAHLGRTGEAIRHWREAIRRDPSLPAPRNNLGALLLESGDRAALATLEAAARLAGSGPHVHYNLALARLGAGDRRGAVEALRRALRAGEYPRAEKLLAELGVVAAGRGPDASP